MGMTDEDKSVEQSYFYDEFGVSLGSWGNVGNHYLCTGQEYDGSITQLYNLRARYYKPSIGRFISEDPTMQSPIQYAFDALPLDRRYIPLNLNPYPYVANNSTNFVDLSGRDRYHMCDRSDNAISRWICRRVVDVGCLFNNMLCCKADMFNCIADLLGTSYDEAREKGEELLECPRDIPDPLMECYEKYLKCLGLGSPLPPVKF